MPRQSSAEPKVNGQPRVRFRKMMMSPPPKSEKETTSTLRTPPGSKSNVTKGKEQWITNRAPCPPMHDASLRGRYQIDNRKKCERTTSRPIKSQPCQLDIPRRRFSTRKQSAHQRLRAIWSIPTSSPHIAATYYYAKSQKTRGWKARTPLGFGKLTTKIAPNSGTWRVVRSSIWYDPCSGCNSPTVIILARGDSRVGIGCFVS